MQKKLTITLDERVYEGLYDVVGAGKISRFIEDLVRPYVTNVGVLHESEARYGVGKASPLPTRLELPAIWSRLGADSLQERIAETLAIALFSEGRISSGKAAQVLGISRVAFLDLLQKRGVAYIAYTDDELAEEFAAVRSLREELNR